MDNITLKTFTSSNGTRYSLNRDAYSIRINDCKNALNLQKENADSPTYQKEYHKNKILRSKPSMRNSYFSNVPKNGTGDFVILDKFNPIDANIGDNKVGLCGKLKNGKIVELRDSNILPAEHVNLKYIQDTLEKVKTGELSLENLTKVYLKKALAFLKK